MQKKKRKTARRFLKLVITGLLLCASYCVLHVLLILAFPQVLFSEHATRDQLTAHMRQEFPSNIDRVLDRAQSLLSASELYDESEAYDIYIINSHRLSRYLLLRNVHFGCNMPTGDTFVVNADVAKDLAFCEILGPRDQRLRSLSETIAHEIAHDLIREHMGWKAERDVPSWIKEGYCEFVAQGSAIDHDLGLSIASEEAPFTLGFLNFKHRLMVEYLLASGKTSIGELLKTPPDYDQVELQVFSELHADQDAFLASIGTTIGKEDPIRDLR